ncbi:Hypothetical Protein FCC1311_028992 [Hondaea fermentalgiana]|uniref:Uncharacterized protein n=1 Tax=Hondaea fermentalgiana TaxID=2315210 RepID=A0A2R5GAB4_9STRA|nr:Hypothetical Protein FCC1311_028992 [Hondaea fermentalgiana]|eukprot:GBG26678.1 Hypothetical Protein FCC1311_028992 [Hondaea fermentalgiana]
MVQYLCEAVAQVLALGEGHPSEEALDNMAAKVRQHHSHYATCPAVAMALLNNEPGAHEKAMEHERVFRAKYSRLKVLLSRREFIKRVVSSLIEGMQAGEGLLEAARQRLEGAAEEEARLQALQFYGDASSVDERCATTAGIYHGDIIVACRPYFAKIEAATEKEHSRACTEIRNLIHGKMAFPRGDTFKGFELVVPSDNSWESRRGIPAIASMTDAELEDADIEIFFGRNLPQLSVALVKLSMTSRCRERFLSEDYLKTKVLAKLEDLIRTCTPDHNIFHDSYESLMGGSLHPDLPTGGIEALTPVDLAFGMVESRIDEYLDYFIDQRWLEPSGTTVRESEGLPSSPDEVEAKEEGWLFDELCRVFFAALEKTPEEAALYSNDRSKIHQRALRRYIHHTLTKENARHGLATSSQGCSIAPVTKRIELTHRLVPALTRAALRDLGRSLDGQADDFERRIFDDDNQRLLKVLNALALRELADLLEHKRLEILEYEKQSLKVDL